MLYVDISQSYNGELRREVFDVGSDEGMTLCLHPPFCGHGSTKQQAMRQLKDMIAQQGLLWIRTGGAEWTIDLDGFLDQNFAADIRKKGWKWLHGIVAMRPELEEMPPTHDPSAVYYEIGKSLTVVFDLTAETIEQNRRRSSDESKTQAKKFQVFVSSTFDDLQEERQHVMYALLEVDCIPTGMELFPANPEQWKWIERAIDECDYYIIIVAGKYGSVDSESGLSYTEREFEYAVRTDRTILAFTHADLGKLPGEKLERNQIRRQKLDAFTQKVKSQRMCKPWINASDLKAAVGMTMHQQIRHNPKPGWIRAESVVTADVALKLREQLDQKELDFAEAQGRIEQLEQKIDVLKTHSVRQGSPEKWGPLSQDATQLLVEVSGTKYGTIRVKRVQGFKVIEISGSANQAFLGKMDNPRDEARWQHALNELLGLDYLQRINTDSFRLSHLGYQRADELKEERVPNTDDMNE